MAAAALRRDPAGSRLFAPCIDSPLSHPPLGPRSPESRTYAQNVVHFAPNTPFSAHAAEADCTLSTTPTIHRTTPPRNGGFCDHTNPRDGVSPACRTPMVAIPPENKTKRGNRARTSWQPPLAPTTPTTPTRPDGTPPASRTYAHNVVHIAPNTPLSAHPAEVDCTLSTTPTIHRTTPPRNGGVLLP